MSFVVGKLNNPIQIKWVENFHAMLKSLERVEHAECTWNSKHTQQDLYNRNVKQKLKQTKQ